MDQSALIKAGAVLLFLFMVPVRLFVQYRRDPEERRYMMSLLRDRQARHWGVVIAIVAAAFNVVDGSLFTAILSALIVGGSADLLLAWFHQRAQAAS